MERCINCKHAMATWDCHVFCAIGGAIKIPHPYFMGGSKKCEFYERKAPKKKFTYPTKADMNPLKEGKK